MKLNLYSVLLNALNILEVYNKSISPISPVYVKQYKVNRLNNYLGQQRKNYYLNDAKLAYNSYINVVDNALANESSLEECKKSCAEAQKNYLEVVNSKNHIYDVVTENQIRKSFNLNEISYETNYSKCIDRCKVFDLYKRKNEIIRKNYNLEILYNDIRNNKISLEEISESDKEQFVDLLGSFDVHKNFTEIYNRIKSKPIVKSNTASSYGALNKNIPTTTTTTTTNKNITDTNVTKLNKRSLFNSCYQYSITGVDQFGKWNLNINSIYGKGNNDYLVKLFNRMDGCSIPDGFIEFLGEIFKPDLYDKAQYLFKYICNAHDMCYHCEDSYSECDDQLYRNAEIVCRNDYSYSLYDYSNYEDCISDGKLIYNALQWFVNGISPKQSFQDDHDAIKDYKNGLDASYKDCVCNDFDKKILSHQAFEIKNVADRADNFNETPIQEIFNFIQDADYKRKLIEENAFNIKNIMN